MGTNVGVRSVTSNVVDIVLGTLIQLGVLGFGEFADHLGALPYAPLLAHPIYLGDNMHLWWALWARAVFLCAALPVSGLLFFLAGTLHHHRRALEALARTDMLTGLPNRRQFMARLAEELARVQRNPSHQAALMILDLDHFKRINDRLGHPAGDKVLRMFAQLLREELRKVDSAGRIGGEEFAVLLPETDLAAARIFGERLRAKVAEASCGQSECPATVTVSIGIAQLEPADADIGAVLSSADQALYQAKKVGRNRVELAPPRAPAGASE